MYTHKFHHLVATLLVLMQGILSPAFAVDETLAVLAEVNLTRQQVGLPALTLNANLNQSAKAHADYLQGSVQTISHYETPGLPGFTGVTPADRMTAAGYGWSSVNEVISGGIASGQSAVRGLVQAIYHRFGILSPDAAEAGIGVGNAIGKSPTFVINLGATWSNAVSMPRGWLGTYPVNGQSDVVRDFFSDTESPDPITNQNRVGYPVSIHAGAQDILLVSSFTLKPIGGAPLAAQILKYPDDPHVPASAAALVPLVLLEFGTQYQADFSGTLNGQNVTHSWTFKTANFSSLSVDVQRQRVGTHQLARIQLSGGNGGTSLRQTQWQSTSPTDPAPKVIEVSPGLFEVSVVAAADVTLTFADAEAQTLSAVVSFADPVSETTSLVKGWNLVGNALQTPQSMLERFGSGDAPLIGVSDKIISVWKWLPARSQWAFYAPSMTAQALATYAASKGYALLDSIQPGEGFWVNASAALSLPTRTDVPSPTVPVTLPVGWSLLGVGGEAVTPAAFDKALSTGALSGNSLCYPTECWRVSGGLAAMPSIKTLWTWDAPGGKWRFFAPSLALQSGTALSDYAIGKGYLPYDLAELMYLHMGEGFWVNK